MIEKTGTVKELEGEYAVVVAEDVQLHDNFITSLYRVQTSMRNTEDIELYALNTVGAKEGDRVKFELPVRKFLDASFLEYIFLFFVLITAIAVELGVVIYAVACILIFKIIRKKSPEKDVARITKIIE